jgi:hypothetical protein
MRTDLLKFDLKSVVTIVTIAVTMAGFYYTLRSRTDVLESEVRALQTEVSIMRGRVGVAEKKIKRLTRTQP